MLGHGALSTATERDPDSRLARGETVATQWCDTRWPGCNRHSELDQQPEWRLADMVHFLPKTKCLNETLFSSLLEARNLLAAWRDDYNRARPHSALSNRTPAEFHPRARPCPSAGNGKTSTQGSPSKWRNSWSFRSPRVRLQLSDVDQAKISARWPSLREVLHFNAGERTLLRYVMKLLSDQMARALRGR